MSEVLDLSLSELAARLKARELSPVEALDACLERIEATEDQLNAYVRVPSESARTEARQAEKAIAEGGWRGPLHGVPVAVKDLYDLAGTPTTASSAAHELGA